jgi:hypothetical protein
MMISDRQRMHPHFNRISSNEGTLTSGSVDAVD